MTHWILFGGAGGIGRAIGEGALEQATRLTLVGRTQSSLDEACAHLRTIKTDLEVHGVVADASSFEASEEVIRAANAEEPVSAVVNAVGSILLKPAHTTSQTDFDDVFRQNITTAFSVVRASSKHLLANQPSILLFSSAAAQIGLPNHEAISAAKSAVEGLVRSTAATYASKGLRINAIAPGLVNTPLAARLVGNEASLKASSAMHPLGRIGQPSDIVALAIFLLSEQSSWVTGQIFGVDGGLSRVKARS